MTPRIHLFVLASGSKGNAAVVRGPEGSVLIDCGISRKALRERAQEAGCDLGDVVAVLVTHEHSDHTAGLSVLSHSLHVPFLATAGTAMGRKFLSGVPFELVDHDSVLELAGMRVTLFPTSHDVNDPFGMRFDVLDEWGEVEDSLGWATDTGYLTDEALAALYGCRILGLESNHDPSMLASGPYPAFLKARVGGERGHLSNEQAAAALPALVSSQTETVVALHLSQENNRPSLAVRALAGAMGADPVDESWGEARTPDGLLTICHAAQDSTLVVY